MGKRELRGRFPTENEVDPSQDETEGAGRHLTDPPREQAPVDRDDLGYVRHRILRQSGHPMSQKHVARGVGQTEVARERHHDDCADTASVECVSLDDENGPSQTRTGADGSWQIRPEDVSLGDYHSLD